jgi:hypothetical protein
MACDEPPMCQCSSWHGAHSIHSGEGEPSGVGVVLPAVCVSIQPVVVHHASKPSRYPHSFVCPVRGSFQGPSLCITPRRLSYPVGEAGDPTARFRLLWVLCE